MSTALAKAARLKADIRLAQAISEFKRDLTTDQKKVFSDCQEASQKHPPSIKDVMQLTAEIDLRQGGRQCFGPRFTNFLQGVQQFAALGDIIAGGSQNLIACGVWSLVRMSLLVSPLTPPSSFLCSVAVDDDIVLGLP